MSQHADEAPSTCPPDVLRPNAVVELLSELFKENSAAETQLLEEYLPRLTRLAAKLMSGFTSASEDEEDIAQSTFKSFFRQVRAGQVFEIPSDAALWALLAKMAKYKALNRIRKERTVKRGGGKVINESDIQQSATHDSPLNSVPKSISPEDFDLACEELLQALEDDELRKIAILLFRGLTQREISQQLGISQSAVQRKVEVIRACWRDFLSDAENSE